MRGYISIECSGNIAVIKTYSGYADVVAQSLDGLGMDEILGTIAGGDNCVFACLREGVSGDQFLDALKLKIPDLDE
jgi:transcriptional regulator of arginine metabolism